MGKGFLLLFFLVLALSACNMREDCLKDCEKKYWYCTDSSSCSDKEICEERCNDGAFLFGCSEKKEKTLQIVLAFNKQLGLR